MFPRCCDFTDGATTTDDAAGVDVFQLTISATMLRMTFGPDTVTNTFKRRVPGEHKLCALLSLQASNFKFKIASKVIDQGQMSPKPKHFYLILLLELT